jgi:hypothetical protein
MTPCHFPRRRGAVGGAAGLPEGWRRRGMTAREPDGGPGHALLQLPEHCK